MQLQIHSISNGTTIGLTGVTVTGTGEKLYLQEFGSCNVNCTLAGINI